MIIRNVFKKAVIKDDNILYSILEKEVEVEE
jgi:hypothetical protein